MGCGGSSQFAAAPPLQPGSEAFAQAAEKARSGEKPLVHLVGLARPSEFLIESPFGGGPGLAAVLTAHHTEAGLFAGTSKALFRARAVVSFRVEIPGASETVLVEASAASRWKFHSRTLNLVHTENNIDRTGPGNMMKGGGKPGHRSQAVERPDGVEWWRTFNKDKDSPDLMQSSGRMIARSRVVREHWLRDGDPVAVLGSLHRAEDGSLRLVADGADGAGWLTNDKSLSKALGELGTPAGEGGEGPSVAKLKMIDERCREGVA